MTYFNFINFDITFFERLFCFAVVANPQENQAVPAGETGEGANAINVRVLHDQGYEQRLQELHRLRDAEMAAIKQYTSDVVEKEDLTEDDLVQITAVLNIIIRAQESQQRELLHGIPDFVRSGAKPEDVRERIEESMARYQEEEDEALRKMKEIMERGAPTAPPEPPPPQRVLRLRRRAVPVPEAAPDPTEIAQQVNQDPFREGLVRHISRIVELNRQLRQESLAQNVALIAKLPKDGRLLGMVVLPHQRTKDEETDNAGPSGTVSLDNHKDDLVQSLRDGEAVWIPAEPPEVQVPVPALPRMERRGAIVEEDMREDVQSIQTLQVHTDDPEPSTSTQGNTINENNEKASEASEELKSSTEEREEEMMNEEAPVPRRILRRRVLVVNNNAHGRGNRRGQRRDNEGNQDNQPGEQEAAPAARGRRRRGRAAGGARVADAEEPPVRRARRH